MTGGRYLPPVWLCTHILLCDVRTQEMATIEELCLWAAPEGTAKDRVVVDPMLTQKLRPHQREGVQFMFECVVGLRQEGRHGCILAGAACLLLGWLLL